MNLLTTYIKQQNAVFDHMNTNRNAINLSLRRHWTRQMRGVSLRYALTGLLSGNTTGNDRNTLWTPMEVKIKWINGRSRDWDTKIQLCSYDFVSMTLDLDSIKHVFTSYHIILQR